MLTLHPERLKKETLPLSTGWLLAACSEAKGKQDLWTRQKPEILAALWEQAIIQSVESSNRIEGVTVPQSRLKPLALGRSRPRDRSEEELAGYRRALDWIFTRKRPPRIEPLVIRHLHQMAQGGFSGDAGEWKSKDNEIIEILPSGERRVRFTPTPARNTPTAMDQLCGYYRDAIQQGRIPELVAVATFAFDFLCIHPFRDGNGRVSRLCTTLLLLGQGYQVSRYVSLERLVEESKRDYYQVLEECSRGWHAGRNEIVPWWNYFLGALSRAYREFEQQVELASTHAAKTELVRRAVEAQFAPFTLGELSAQVPSASPQLIKRVLSQLKKAGYIRLVGRGRGARWEVRR